MSLNDILNDTKSIIFGCEGLNLSPQEKAFFTSAKPLGFILFARNIDTPAQVQSLITELRDTVGWHCPILVDQEGGRVQRLSAPNWKSHKPAAYFGENPSEIKDNYASISKMISAEGFSVNCVPCADVPREGSHDIIGDRAFGDTPELVAECGLSVIETCIENNITPVIKHLPGHGRAKSDSHEKLPKVHSSLEALEETDFKAFKDICSNPISSQAWGMTAHVIYSQIDEEYPATLSKTVVSEIIRKYIGFDGFLLGDDLFMKALDDYGDLPTRILKSQHAGIDAHLYCHGNVDDMKAAIEVTQNLTKDSIKRFLNSYRPTEVLAA